MLNDRDCPTDLSIAITLEQYFDSQQRKIKEHVMAGGTIGAAYGIVDKSIKQTEHRLST